MDESGHADQNDAENSNVQVAKRRSPYSLILLLLLFIGGVFTYYNWSQEEDELLKTAKEYLETVRTGNLTNAYYTYTSAGFQKETSLKNFVASVKGNLLFEKMGSLHIQSNEAAEGKGTLKGFITTTDGFQAPFTLWLVKEDDEWKIDRFEAGASVKALEKQKVLEEVRVPIMAQLRAIRNGALDNAYFEETADEFKSATPIDNFKRFLGSFPEIQESRHEEFIEVNSRGGQATVELAVYTPSKSMKLVYEMIQDKGRWKIFSMQVLPVENPKEISSEDLQSIERAVQKQLALLSSGKLEEAYELTSKAFKAGTSKIEFDSFIKEHPFFEKNEGSKTKKWIDRNIGKALVEIQEAGDVYAVDFTLFKENDEWKIWGMEVRQVLEDGQPNAEEDQRFVSHLLRVIQEGKLQEAYDLSMAQDFKKVTSFEEFKNFVEVSPFFKSSWTAKLFERATLNDKAIVKVEFVSGEESSPEVLEFDLVKEESKWKVVGIKVLDISSDDSEEEVEGANLDLALELLNGEKSAQGTYRVKSSLSTLQAILNFEGAAKGEVLGIQLIHLESGHRLGEKKFVLDKGGKGSLPLFITIPDGSLATGKYELLISDRRGKHSFLIESMP
ncbi:DUF4864 domain-containing protein [Estrella lausannensis]|uniref:Putative membrane protein n=1 Tax=Estrella lausannensis TaxID=483423 RepID=A0A0H5DPR2_9BACT|nr:DUF4864 domain-containing protein [Estrella lausannensis]CRX37484.1 putative membrane protein [Estrella lausannensis]